MNETSAEYQAGFATLLPNEAIWDCLHYETVVPNIREDEAAAWRALMALRAMERTLFVCHMINGKTPIDALYATIEGIGRHHD